MTIKEKAELLRQVMMVLWPIFCILAFCAGFVWRGNLERAARPEKPTAAQPEER